MTTGTQLRHAITEVERGRRVAQLLCPPSRSDKAGTLCSDRRLQVSPDSMFSAVRGKANENREFVEAVVNQDLAGFALEQMLAATAAFEPDPHNLTAVPDDLLPTALEPATQERLLLLAHVAGRELLIIGDMLAAVPAHRRTQAESDALAAILSSK